MDTHYIPDGFDYVGSIYRPPAEAHNILVQATVGCSHNACTFCSSYARKRFSIKDRQRLEADLRFAARYCRRQDRVFVLDGNALAMPMPDWEWLLTRIAEDLPWVLGIGCFATGMDIAGKSDEDLIRLRELGLDRLYLGVESGHAAVLRQVRKGIGPEDLRAQGRRAKAAGMWLNISVLLGMVDEGLSLAHARATGGILSAIDPEHVTVMTLIPQTGSVMSEQIASGELRPPDTPGLLAELREMLEHTQLSGGVFDYSHSSALLSFSARLPYEKELGLGHIDLALSGAVTVRDEEARRL